MNKIRVTIVAAAVIHLGSFLLMMLEIEPFYTFFYSIAWWSFIVLVAGLNHELGGNSFLFDRFREFAWLCVFSILTWLFFEAYNFRLENWNYVGVPLSTYLRWPGYIIAYATVLPGVFETERLLFNFGLGRKITWRRLRVSRGLVYRFLIIGVLMMGAPLLSPSTFFPLVWVGLIFLLDPLLYLSRRRQDSLLAVAAEGEFGLMIRLLVTGLVCGGLWEFWNYWAGSKWIYSIPLFDFLKIFEMPVLGYLGFAFFAVECYLIYRLLLLVRVSYLETSRVRLALVAFLAVVFTIAVISGIDQMTVVSYKILLGN